MKSKEKATIFKKTGAGVVGTPGIAKYEDFGSTLSPRDSPIKGILGNSMGFKTYKKQESVKFDGFNPMVDPDFDPTPIARTDPRNLMVDTQSRIMEVSSKENTPLSSFPSRVDLRAFRINKSKKQRNSS